MNLLLLVCLILYGLEYLQQANVTTGGKRGMLK